MKVIQIFQLICNLKKKKKKTVIERKKGKERKKRRRKGKKKVTSTTHSKIETLFLRSDSARIKEATISLFLFKTLINYIIIRRISKKKKRIEIMKMNIKKIKRKEEEKEKEKIHLDNIGRKSGFAGACPILIKNFLWSNSAEKLFFFLLCLLVCFQGGEIELVVVKELKLVYLWTYCESVKVICLANSKGLIPNKESPTLEGAMGRGGLTQVRLSCV